MKPPAPEQPKPQEPPKEAPRRGEEQIVYIKLDELHAFKNHPFQVRDDEEMRAMVSSVKDKGVTQPAKVTMQELHAAISRLPNKQAKRIYAHFILGMSVTDIARAEGVAKSRVSDSIRRGLRNMEKILRNKL